MRRIKNKIPIIISGFIGVIIAVNLKDADTGKMLHDSNTPEVDGILLRD